jgi:hypothetical protein
MGIGACRSGTKVCAADGVAYGECQGEVLPTAADDCTTPEDENCDGAVNDGCPCEPGSVETCYSGPAGTSEVGICLAGTHTCKADLTWGVCVDEQLPIAEDCSNAIDEDCDGFACAQTLWALLAGDGSSQTAFGIATLSNGNVVATGRYEGTIEFGGPPLISTGWFDAFVVQFDASGNHLWSRSIGGSTLQEGASIAADPQGNIFVAGRFVDSLSEGSTTLTSTAYRGQFLAKYLSDGTVSWIKKTSDTHTFYEGPAVATDNGGNVVIAETTVDDCGTCNDSGARVAKFDTNGNLVWNTSFTGSGISPLTSIAIDSVGSVIVGGSFSAELNAGSQSIPAVGTTRRTIVAKLSDSGDVTLLRTSTGPGGAVTAVGVNDVGEILIGGDFSGTMQFGSATLVSMDSGDGDAFLIKMGSGGSVEWSKLISATVEDSEELINSCSFDSTGNVLMGGTFNGPISFGGAMLPGASTAVVKFDGDGVHLWSRLFDNSAAIWGVSTGAADEVLVAGAVSGDFDFGTGVLASGGGDDAFVAKLAP